MSDYNNRDQNGGQNDSNHAHKGQALLDALFNINYDFSRPSKLKYNGVSDLSTLEIMLMVPVDTVIFEQVFEFAALRRPRRYIQIMDEIK